MDNKLRFNLPEGERNLINDSRSKPPVRNGWRPYKNNIVGQACRPFGILPMNFIGIEEKPELNFRLSNYLVVIIN